MNERARRSVAVVTGAARGIGAAIATRLARAGCDVALVDVLDCADTAAGVSAAGGRAWSFTLDLTDRSAVRRELGAFVEDQGRVDTLVHNAGIVSTAGIQALTDDEWDKVLAVNLTAAVVSSQVVWPSMVRQGDGRLIFIGSRAARTGGNNAGPAYVASKGGIQALVVALAKEGAPLGIRANAVMPGPIATEMTVLPSYGDPSAATPMGRMGRPAEIADAVAYLASDDSSFVTGTVLNVSGGLLMG